MNSFFNSRPITPDYALADQYLLKRGITKELRDLCDIEVRGATELSGWNTCFNRSGIVFRYRDVHRALLEYETVRWVDNATASHLRVVGGRDLPKLGTPPKKLVKAYFPAINDWTKLQRGDRIYFHESAIKAICGAALGKFSVGLNGVYGFGSKKHNVSLLEEIVALPWIELALQPVIVFDSNWGSNAQVGVAISRLAGALSHQFPGILPCIHLQLQKRADGGDWGFDDAYATLGDGWATKYLEGDGVGIDSSPLHAARMELNNEVVWVEEMGQVIKMDENYGWSASTFIRAAYADRFVLVQSGEKTGLVSVADAWMKWTGRNCVKRMSYEPGKGQLVLPDYYNTWKGMGAEPVEGDVGPFLEVLENNLHSHADRQWLVRWLAYPLQNLGAKLLTNVVLVGPPGTGKSWLCELMGRIYGDNYVEIGREQLESSFNSVYHTKQFININEVTRSSSREKSIMSNNKLKMLTTSPTLVVNRKGAPEWTCDNHSNIIITTNYSDGLYLDEHDRRSAVFRWEPGVSHKDDRPYWEEKYGWRDGSGAAHLYYWLLSLDLSGFDPSGWAPGTAAKEDMIVSARTPWEGWVIDLVKDPESIVGSAGRRIFTNKELRTLCRTQLELDYDPSQILFGTALKAHFHYALGVNEKGAPKKIKVESFGELYFCVIGAPFVTHEEARKHILTNRSVGRRGI